MRKYALILAKLFLSVFAVLLFWKLEQYLPEDFLVVFLFRPLLSSLAVVIIWLKIWRGDIKLEAGSTKAKVGKVFASMLVIGWYRGYEVYYSVLPADMMIPYPVFLMFLLRIVCCIVVMYVWVPSVFGKYRHLMLIGCILPCFMFFYCDSFSKGLDTSAPESEVARIERKLCLKHLQYESFFTPLPAHCEKRLKQNADTAPETTQESKPQEMHE